MRIKTEVLETELSPGTPGQRLSIFWPDRMMSSLCLQTVADRRVLAGREKSFLGATCPGLFQKWNAQPPGTCCQLSQADQIADFILFF